MAKASKRARSSARVRSEPPDFVAPMLAKLAAAPPTGEGWVHEVKFDGYRIQARLADRAVTLKTRAGIDWTARLGARVVRALSRLDCANAILDGELIAENKAGVSDFAALAEDLSRGDDANVAYCVFDLIFLNGEDLRHAPLVERKARLKRLLGSSPPRPLRYSAHREGDGAKLLRQACKDGLEGVVSKRKASLYTSDRGGAWIKAKCVDRQEFIIAGFTPSTVLKNAVGALALAVRERGKLRYAGRVGAGFTHDGARTLFERLAPLKRSASPFAAALSTRALKGVVWVKPILVAEIEFRTWTKEGLVRQGAFKGLREDKPAREIVAERVKPEKG